MSHQRQELPQQQLLQQQLQRQLGQQQRSLKQQQEQLCVCVAQSVRNYRMFWRSAEVLVFLFRHGLFIHVCFRCVCGLVTLPFGARLCVFFGHDL